MTKAYKLLRVRKDGSLGPLFINRRQRIPIGEWLDAENHPTKGYAVRPVWHCTLEKRAPHMKMGGRVWCEVIVDGEERYNRPESQGGTWLIAKRMMVISICQ